MKKTVVFEFPDGFDFPQCFEEEHPARCRECLMYCIDDDQTEWCFLTKDGDYTPKHERILCPFSKGENVINVKR